MPTYPLYGVNQQGRSPVVTAQRHLNLYAQIERDAEKAKVVFFGTPGLSLFSSVNGDTPIRGWIVVGSLLYYVHRGTFYEINNAGSRTSRGTLSTTTGHVDMAYDGAVILLVDGTAGYTYTVATTTLATIVSANFPNGSNTCTWLDGQFICDAGSTSDSFYISADGTTWDALDFATAESNPDGLVRVLADNGEIVLAGSKTIEFWGNTGNADFPFQAIKGSTQEFGLIARWSLTSFNSGLAGIFAPSTAQAQVMFIAGYVPTPISTPEIDYLINNYSTISDATAYSYMLGGHPMLQINFPTAGKSWLYDATSGLWSPLEYGLSGERHRGELAAVLVGSTVISDYSNGNIYKLQPEVYTDNGTAIAREIVARHVFKDNLRVPIDELFVDFETGVGLQTGQGSDPQAMLQVSKDGGRNWGIERWVTIGKVGKYLTRAVWRQFGVARDWLFKIRITDPVKVVITYAALRARR